MECCNCHTKVSKAPLHRTNPYGQRDGGWMCKECIGKLYPELLKNIKEEEMPLEKVLVDLLYGPPPDTSVRVDAGAKHNSNFWW